MKRSQFWLGLVAGAILAAMLLFSVYYVPRKGLSLSREPLPFTLVLDQANGLRAGSPVLVSGVEAGEVEGIEIREIPGRGFKVMAAVSVFDGERFARDFEALCERLWARACAGLAPEHLPAGN